MKKTSINVCDVCNDRISMHSCSMCNKDVCRFCGYFPKIFTSSINKDVTVSFEPVREALIKDRQVVCQQCIIKLRTAYTEETKEELLKSFFKIMKKALTVQRLTETKTESGKEDIVGKFQQI